MKYSAIFCLLLLIITGCNNLTTDPNETPMNELDYLMLESSPLSHATNTNFEPNEFISTDALLEKQINGKIRQLHPELATDVIVHGNRIIISSLHTEEETTRKAIRDTVSKLIGSRKLMIVTDDVFQLYRNSYNKQQKKNPTQS